MTNGSPVVSGAARLRVMLVSPCVEPGADAEGVVDALRSLGSDAQLELIPDLETARPALSSSEVDCWIADEALGATLLPWLSETSRAGGPPCVVLVRGGGAEFALAAFEHGAGACVSANDALAQALPAAVRSQAARRTAIVERGTAASSFESGSLLDAHGAEIIRTMNSALWLVDCDARIDFANPAAAQIVGLDVEELAGLPISHFFRDRDPEEIPIQRVLDHGERLRGAETVLTRDDGRVVPIGLSCAPFSRGSVRAGAVVIFQDLTEAKQLEQQGLQAEKMASIGQLAAGVAHEINNPMGFIHANLCQLTEYTGDLARVWERVETLRKTAAATRVDPAALKSAAAELQGIIDEVDAGFLMEDFAKAIGESLEGSERVRNIVQDLRAFSHQDTAERVLTDVNKALDSTANIVWTMMKHSVRLTKEYADLPALSCFPVPLKQVFMNLMINAYQAIEERAELDAEHRGEIRLATKRSGDGVQIVVTDNGCGMSADVMARIFDPFFTTKEIGVGTGLGLSTSFNLIERHHGTLTVESRVGEGSTFEVWIPIEEPAS